MAARELFFSINGRSRVDGGSEMDWSTIGRSQSNVGTSLPAREEWRRICDIAKWTGRLPLVLAVNSDMRVESFREILRDCSVRATINEIDPVNGATALLSACSRDHSEFARCLVQAGADLECWGRLGLTPLHVACQRHGHLMDRPREEIVAVLLEAGADTNVRAEKTQRTPLHMAVHPSGSATTTRALLSAGAFPGAADEAGETALHLAVGNERAILEGVVRLLVDAGAPLHVRTVGGGNTPIEMFATVVTMRRGFLPPPDYDAEKIFAELEAEAARRRAAWRGAKLKWRCWVVAVREELDVDDFIPPVVIRQSSAWMRANPWVRTEPNLNAAYPPSL